MNEAWNLGGGQTTVLTKFMKERVFFVPRAYCICKTFSRNNHLSWRPRKKMKNYRLGSNRWIQLYFGSTGIRLGEIVWTSTERIPLKWNTFELQVPWCSSCCLSGCKRERMFVAPGFTSNVLLPPYVVANRLPSPQNEESNRKLRRHSVWITANW